jgi:preprotein translocase subunit SecE
MSKRPLADEGGHRVTRTRSNRNARSSSNRAKQSRSAAVTDGTEEFVDDAVAEDDVEDTRARTVKATVDKSEAKPAVRTSGAKSGTGGTTRTARRTGRGDEGGFFLVRWFNALVRYIREIVSEMRKVIWPTRQEMITYTTVVVIFVVIVVAFVAFLDIGFAKLVLWMFG